jgi:putative ABC transport system permease protein
MKEVGVRKVLGGSVSHISHALNSRFLILLALAGFIALPASYALVNVLLDNTYAYHIDVGPGAVFIAYGLVVGIFLITISTQTLRLVSVNPVEVLRKE